MHCVTTPVYGRKSVVENATINNNYRDVTKTGTRNMHVRILVTKKSDTQLLFDSGIDIVAAFRKDDHNQCGETP